MKSSTNFLGLLLVLLVFQLKAQENSLTIEKKKFSIGETFTIPSKTLNEDRIINVYLPHGYLVNTDKKYPIIYLLDGSADEDFIHVAGLVQFGSFSWINMIPETIVVGIANSDRKRDLTYPTNNKKDKEEFPTTGGSQAFIDFLEAELQPMIVKEYRTAGARTLIGQSLGGLLATEILFKRPNMFDNYIIISPSLWWDDESLLKFTPKGYTTKKSVYVGVGKEGPTMQKVAKELFQKLKAVSKENTSLYFNFFEELDHGDTLHLATYDSFNKIFRKEKSGE
ncbi:alpha/beta hydrolase [Aquimarina celericrescens]|uniref:Alpha/beta hydrolase n=1 Tax=Aquimarina celericrescens TaxID=1964542 RepID=A0ABW5B4B2_9FLAO|nr:alpha/beta hydrolase [Aquimarina celericrescens]